MAADFPPGTPAPSERPCEREGEIRDFGGQRVGAGPCVDREGNVVRHSAYVYPSRGQALVVGSTVAGALLAVLLIGVYFVAPPSRPSAGRRPLRAVLSPAPTYSRHSLATLDCAQCHRAGHNVEDVRCERCHDAAVTARLSNAAHVYQGTGNVSRALAAPAAACATCHLEHQGADVHFAGVDDRECGACHRAAPDSRRLASFAQHPEFALVREGRETGGPLRWFNHKLHVAKVQTKYAKTCEACHQRRADAQAFDPIVFRTHCADCHEADMSDSAGTMTADTLKALGPLPAPLRTRPDFDDPARVGVTGITHADRWVLNTVQALRASYDPGGAALERTLLDRQLAQLELRQSFGPAGRDAGAWTGLTPVARAPGDAPAADGVRGAAAALEDFVGGLTPADPAASGLRDEATKLKQTTATTPPANGPALAGPVRANVDPLRALLQATLARANAAGDPDVTRRATDLLARLDALSAAARQTSASPYAAGAAPVLQALMASGDPRVRAAAREIDDLTRIVGHQAAGGIDPSAFDRQRQQILSLLDASQRAVEGGAASAAGAGVLARLAALRQAVLASDYRLSPDTAAARTAFFQARQIDRVRIDTELDAAGLRGAPPVERVDPADTNLERLRELRLQLAAIASPTRIGALPAADARGAIAALIGTEAADAEQNALQKNRCTLCHELTPGGDALMPVRAVGGALLTKSRFNHAPHVTAGNANCESCHTNIRASTGARDLNLPNVASCVTCHAPGKSGARAVSCQSCHRYHVSSPNALVWMP